MEYESKIQKGEKKRDDYLFQYNTRLPENM